MCLSAKTQWIFWAFFKENKRIAKNNRYAFLAAMKINEMYGKKFVVSFEIFPPKTPAGDISLWKEMELLSAYKPDFVSVTYGAGGSTRARTLSIAVRLRDEYGITPIAHFTCAGSSRDDIRAYIKTAKEMGIDNILALRGDPPAGESVFTPNPEGFSHANELIEFIRDMGGFTIAAAGYPEVHTEASDRETDLLNLKKKQDAGAHFIITQLFYDNNVFYDFMDRVRKININIPIIPGIMPITAKGQIDKLVNLSGTHIPLALLDKLNKCSSPEDEAKIGLEFSAAQCMELKSFGVEGLHIYTMNRSRPVINIMKELNL